MSWPGGHAQAQLLEGWGQGQKETSWQADLQSGGSVWWNVSTALALWHKNLLPDSVSPTMQAVPENARAWQLFLGSAAQMTHWWSVQGSWNPEVNNTHGLQLRIMTSAGHVAHTFTWENLWVWGLPGPHSKFQDGQGYKERSFLKKIKIKEKVRKNCHLSVFLRCSSVVEHGLRLNVQHLAFNNHNTVFRSMSVSLEIS